MTQRGTSKSSLVTPIETSAYSQSPLLQLGVWRVVTRKGTALSPTLCILSLSVFPHRAIIPGWGSKVPWFNYSDRNLSKSIGVSTSSTVCLTSATVSISRLNFVAPILGTLRVRIASQSELQSILLASIRLPGDLLPAYATAHGSDRETSI